MGICGVIFGGICRGAMYGSCTWELFDDLVLGMRC